MICKTSLLLGINVIKHTYIWSEFQLYNFVSKVISYEVWYKSYN
jgi:hypothetical protein